MVTRADAPSSFTQVPRDPQDCSIQGTTSARNLVVCIDGTSNKFGTKNTNVLELLSHVRKSKKQPTFYKPGLGVVLQAAGASPVHQLSSVVDMAIGRNLQKTIIASYRWLSEHYEDGDRIFLFGFSRGAYQVRALAGMIARVGLLLPGNNEKILEAFERYSNLDDNDSSPPSSSSLVNDFRSPNDSEASQNKMENEELAQSFRKAFCHTNVHIHFVGVWDTVSAVGLNRSKLFPSTTTSCDHICYFRHALALDERRVKFLPEYVYGGRSDCIDDERVKEVWFAGCHGDIGGGNRRNVKLQSRNIPLLWMRNQAASAGLEMEQAPAVMWGIDDLNTQITPSLDFKWWLLELLPLKRLLYHNSDRHTFRPHLGSRRKILPGQKVHVSVLFKNNYRPYARFYNNSATWPEPMFSNDADSHKRLRDLPDSWEKVIFDEKSARPLLDYLKQGVPNSEVLHCLMFMSSFDVGKEAISHDAKAILAPFLHNRDRVIRLCTAAVYCELGWEWPSETHRSLVEQIGNDVSGLLNSKDCHRACIYLPSLCKLLDLRPGLINRANLRKLVEFCDTTRIGRHAEGTAFHGARTLAMLMKLPDARLAQSLIDIQAVTDITEALRLDSGTPALVFVLSVVNGLAQCGSARDVMKIGTTVVTILQLVKRYDDFVAPAAIRVLCSFLPDDDLRQRMLEIGVLPAFYDALDRCSAETKQVVCRALVEFGTYEEVQRAVSADCLKFAKQAQVQAPHHNEGAILALVSLSDSPVKTVVIAAMQAEKTIPTLVTRLKQKVTALSAASTLARLVKIDEVAAMISGDESAALVGIVDMLHRRWFDGLHGEDGLRVLSELLACDLLRMAVLKSGAIGVLSNMISSQQFETTNAGLHYLRVIGRFDQNGTSLSDRDTRSLVPHVVNALRMPYRPVHRIAVEILRGFSVRVNVRLLILHDLLDLLTDRRAIVILAASIMLRFLAADKSVRDNVLADERFGNMCHDYHDGLVALDYGNKDKSKSPRRGTYLARLRCGFQVVQRTDNVLTAEVYESVGRTIQLIQGHDDDRDGAARNRTRTQEEKGWLAHVPYEI